jgi:hypothetical protein
VTTTQTAPPDPAPPPPLSPGRYLQLRRRAAGLKSTELALLVASDERRPVRLADRTATERRIVALESDQAGPGVDLDFVRRLNRHVRFDEQIYLALVGLAAAPDDGLPVPQHCRQCGCSWNDACVSPSTPACFWADAAGTLCSACPPLRVAPRGTAPSPFEEAR